MNATCRLYLTLLLVVPLMAVPDLEDVSESEEVEFPSYVSSISGEHLPSENRNKNRQPTEDLGSLATDFSENSTSSDFDGITTTSEYTTESQTTPREEQTATQEAPAATEVPRDVKHVGIPEGVPINVYGWLKKRRQVDLETAEQVMFRPFFRHKQIMEDQKERQRVSDALRRQSLESQTDTGRGGYGQVFRYQPLAVPYLSHSSQPAES